MAKQLSNKANDLRTLNKPSSNFLCCFGFFHETPHKKPQPKESINTVDRSDHDHDDCDHKKLKRKSRDKITVRLRLCLKTNRTSIKTVPVLVDTEPEREIKSIHNSWSKPKSKSKPDDQRLTMAEKEKPPNDQLSIVTVVPTSPDKKSPKRNPLQNANLENRKYLAQSNTSTDDTCQKRLSFSRKIDAIRTWSSQPGSPICAKPNKPVRVMKHSESLPSGSNRTKASKPTGRVRESAVVWKRFEPVVGMSVVMVTLVIMIMWGRLCAILCTSAWLYFLPRLSTAVVDPDSGRFGSGSGMDGLDLGSEEYKKKVVFEGFLERNNYNK